MNKTTLAFGIIVLLTLVGVAAMYWLPGSSIQDSQTENSLVVAATIFPLADIAKNVAGEHAQIVTIVPPNASPHSYELTPQKLVELADIDVVFSIGHGLDDSVTAAVQRLMNGSENARTIVVDEDIALREFGSEVEHEEEEPEDETHGHEGKDPHYWLTAVNAQKITQTIANRLGELDPAHAEEYQRNAADYINELAQLEQELQGTARGLTQKHFIAMHDAWEYFADQYGLELVATYEPEEGQEPSPADIQRLGSIINEYDITVFYAEPQKASTAATRLLSEEFGLEILTLDAEGSFAGTVSYIDMMRRNMQAIAEGGR